MAVNHSFVGDIVSLTKPKITLMAVLLAAAGLLHAEGKSSFFSPALMSLIGIAALVSGSSALNMYLEREQDKKMTRTKDRPLPAARINAWWAMGLGWVCAVAASYLLYAASNILTLILGLSSSAMYLFFYTPLKQRTWLALIVGSVPGAMPVALGYVSLANAVDGKVITLFLWAFLWQIPHFLAISMFRAEEYTAAGFPVLSKIAGEKAAKWTVLVSSWLLVFSTFGFYLTGMIKGLGLLVCLMLGVQFLVACHRGCFKEDTNTWARKAFKASLVYQSFLFLMLIVVAFL